MCKGVAKHMTLRVSKEMFKKSSVSRSCFTNEIFWFQGFLKISALVLTNSLTLSFLVRAQLFSWELHCPDHVHGRCCALNKLQQTRHVWITCFKINPAVYRSVGSRLWTQAGARVLCRGPAPCHVPVLHNRCLIREEQGGAHTGRGLSNGKPASAEERRRALLWLLW